MGNSICIDDINILQDLYDPESPPQVLQPDSKISVRVNPSGELFFVYLYSKTKVLSAFITYSD
jgi:hypothetical protein